MNPENLLDEAKTAYDALHPDRHTITTHLEWLQPINARHDRLLAALGSQNDPLHHTLIINAAVDTIVAMLRIVSEMKLARPLDDPKHVLGVPDASTP